MPRLVRGRVPCSRTVASSAARSAVCGAGAPGSCCAERQLTQADRPGSTDQTTPWVTHMPPRTNGTPAGTQARVTPAAVLAGEATTATTATGGVTWGQPAAQPRPPRPRV